MGSSAVEVKEGELKGKADGALRAAASSDDGENGGGIGGAALMRTKSRKALEEERAQEVEENGSKEEDESNSVGDKIKNLVLGDGNGKNEEEEKSKSNGLEVETPTAEVKGPAEVKKAAKRTLYTANVGDARAVLSYVPFLISPSHLSLANRSSITSRGGRAVRLTYDHKGSDSQEAKRITDAGGYVMNNRVNGMLLSVLLLSVHH